MAADYSPLPADEDGGLNNELDKAGEVHHEGGVPQEHDVVYRLDKPEQLLLAQLEAGLLEQLLDFPSLDHLFLDRVDGALAFVERAKRGVLLKQVLENRLVLEHQHSHGVPLSFFFVHLEIDQLVRSARIPAEIQQKFYLFLS